MGSQCLKKTPNQLYRPYLGQVSELKQRWSSIRLFKLKKLFQSHCQSGQTMTAQSFILLFPEIQNKKHPLSCLQRLFDLFDREGRGYLDWSSFLQALSVCYFASTESLAALLFCLHDQELQLYLTHNQLIVLLDIHGWMLQDDLQEDYQDLISEAGLTVASWIQQSPDWLDYEKMRGLFSIFAEQELERDLGNNFDELNRLDAGGKAVGYVINMKWFDCWATYMQKQYQSKIATIERQTIYSRTYKTLRTNKTIKSIKTKKTMKSGKSLNSGLSHKRLQEMPKLKHLPSMSGSQGKHYNLIHHNLGDRPPPIYNNLLEGQYPEVLATGLVEGKDYVLISQQVWRRLKLIYGAYPEFRRSGNPDIEIYPKTIKIYPLISKGLIDYNQEKICQFSCKASLAQLLSKALNLKSSELKERAFFFKTCGMDRWRHIKDPYIEVGSLTSEQLIFLAVPKSSDSLAFSEVHCCQAEQPSQLHVGDEFLYNQNKQRPRHAILIQKNNETAVIHFKGTSYIFDLSLPKDLLEERATLLPSIQGPKKVRMEEDYLYPISDSLGLGFPNGVLLLLLSNCSLCRLFRFSLLKQSPFLHQLASVYSAITSGSQNSAIEVADWIRQFFPQHLHFQLPMAEQFLSSLMGRLYSQIGKLDEYSPFQPISDYSFDIQKHIKCESCGLQEKQTENNLLLTLPVQEENKIFFEVIWAPYAFSLLSVEHVKVGFSLHRYATFAQYKEQFERVAGIKAQPYALVQVYGSDIIKCYLNALPDVTLEHLQLRQEDTIYAFELCCKLDSFITDHYTSDSEVKIKNLKIGQMIDFYSKQPQSKEEKQDEKEQEEEKKWAFGRIYKTEMENYTHKTIIGVQVRQAGGKREIQIKPEEGNVAPFPVLSFKNAEHYHIKCLQRVYNRVANEMELVSVPFVVVAANWMRPRQLQLLIYQQVRDQIAHQGRFILEEAEGGKMPKKQKIRKFREYLSKVKPYTIKFTDQEGRCAFCCKIQKTQLLSGEEDYICTGCESLLDPQEPLFWCLRPYQLRICLDWNSTSSYCPPQYKLHSSFSSSLAAHRFPIPLESCIQLRLEGEYLQDPCPRCLEEGKLFAVEQIVSIPEKLFILLQRGEESNLNRRSVDFDLQCLRIGQGIYQLAGAVAFGHKKTSLNYITFLKDKGKWALYQGQTVHPVKKIVLQKSCPFLLCYHRVDSELEQEKK